MKKFFVLSLCLTFGLMNILAVPATGQSEPYESYFLYLNTYPASKSPGWHEDVQGITHDDAHWFITQSDADDSDPAERSLWKIPVGHNLVSDAKPGVNGVERILLDDTQLGRKGYDHFGDLTYYYNKDYDKKGYLVIPVTGGPYPVIAVFRSSDLGYVGNARLNHDAGWCAIDPDGYLYTSSGQDSSCYKYKLRWDLLPNEVKLELQGEIPFLDESGNPLALACMQGGVFSESGHLLYISSGFYDKHYPNDGINVFDTRTHRRVAYSTNGYGHFDYEFHPGFIGGWEEPEGLTIWDLDDGRAPGITGQLHALLLDNDAPSNDDVFIKHYTDTIYVDGAYYGMFLGNGRPWSPYNTVSEANNLAWNGASISIKAGTYPESLTFSKRIQVLAEGGTVIIGTWGRISLSALATVNISDSGDLKIY